MKEYIALSALVLAVTAAAGTNENQAREIRRPEQAQMPLEVPLHSERYRLPEIPLLYTRGR